MPTVILSPHFDDAVLSCWSVLRSGSSVSVVNFFTGTPPAGASPALAEELTGSRGTVERARERAEEDAEALALVGSPAVNLGLLEYPHWRARSERYPLHRAWSALNLLLRRDDGRRRLREVIACAPRIDRAAHVYAPAGLGLHPDHVLVRDYACRLLQDGIRVSFYADQPYCYAYGWPHWVIGEEADPRLDITLDWRRQLESAPVDFERLRERAVRLDRGHWHEKLRAMRLYRTQFSILEGGANRRLSNPDLTGWEVFWDAEPAA